uniref:Uncharacterized protein n=1 Tax=Romanomermis culicivorax TaxID=13658 RepID=A0A915KMV7_ROMCU
MGCYSWFCQYMNTGTMFTETCKESNRINTFLRKDGDSVSQKIIVILVRDYIQISKPTID